jgi:hypothetical protein
MEGLFWHIKELDIKQKLMGLFIDDVNIRICVWGK